MFMKPGWAALPRAGSGPRRAGLMEQSSGSESVKVAQALLASGAGTQSQQTVSMETGTLEMLSGIAPGLGGEEKQALQRPLIAASGGSSGPELCWGGFGPAHRAAPGARPVLVTPPSEEASGGNAGTGPLGFVLLGKSPSTSHSGWRAPLGEERPFTTEPPCEKPGQERFRRVLWAQEAECLPLKEMWTRPLPSPRFQGPDCSSA